MIIWEEHRGIIIFSIIVIIFFLLDELAYYGWRKVNPGAIYSHLFDKSELSILDPSKPPTTYYE